LNRIDRALTRAGVDEPGGESAAANQSVFQSAWPANDTPDATPRDEPTATIVEPSGRPPHTAGMHGFADEERERLAIGPDGNRTLIERFRRLAATLYHAQSANGLRTVMVTSASTGDGKTMTAVNLALVLSESYRRKVLLVDADLRRPSIRYFKDLDGAAGLSEALAAPTDRKLALVPITPLLTLLPAGRPVADPIGGLTSARMRTILSEAAALFDWIIVDAPPVGPMADASLLAEMVDGTLFVVRAGRTQHPVVQKAIESIGRDRVLGIVLNDVERMPAELDTRYYGGGRESAEDSR